MELAAAEGAGAKLHGASSSGTHGVEAMPAVEQASGLAASDADLEAPPAPADNTGRSSADGGLIAAAGAAPEAPLAAAGPAASPPGAGPWDEVGWEGRGRA
ncbi:hypothetical protein MNEG_14533 [Monoraphidium neglectum]|uniref:Uncharacterized protein n=1 Tax=Monoraphidium neglectum TaxID=145388 RepID=A0A0D2MDZ9_9CHLO|nr:hypothetical protein MNEG_14533 [Monoraphidium neglectum]KIY93430.1 hypothetical protein MNEG_14533 [Monoraphidium neglectum]|eukprot:XP_013892450.1 hypothetical protein MNEG_14533 [Monoraphidium neglectum]